MNITDEQRAKAKALFAEPLVHEILDGLEESAVNAGVYAPTEDNNARQAAMAEVRAIRALRSKLKHISADREGDEA